MPKLPSQFMFSHKEMVTLMLRNADTHEGLWTLIVNFMMAAGNFGRDPESANPSAIVSIQSMGLKKVDKPGPLIFDAAELNPLTTQ